MTSRLALLVSHIVGDAVLLWIGFYWLGLDESDAPHLLWSAAVVLLVILGAAWLHGLTFAHFSGVRFPRAAALSARHLLALGALILVTFALYRLLHWVATVYGGAAYAIGSYSTMKLHRPVPPTSVQHAFHFIVRLLQWVVLPALLLPIAAAISVDGWRGVRWRFIRRRRTWLYWIEVAVLLFCAVWVPFKLFFWVPQVTAFNAQLASFVLRIGVGYLLFVVCVLALEFLTASGRPLVNQPRTVVSP